MTMPMQAKLLRALQEKEIERVGESKSIKFDARIVAGHQPRPEEDGQGRDVPRGPLLPART